jgi:co-chaperonin GroES (HSP10)
MRATDFRPVLDRVFIKQDQDEGTTPGGIVIPEASRKGRELINTGVVVAIGPGRWIRTKSQAYFAETTIKPGERVVWRRHGGIQIGALEDHVITTEDELLGVIE